MLRFIDPLVADAVSSNALATLAPLRDEATRHRDRDLPRFILAPIPKDGRDWTAGGVVALPDTPKHALISIRQDAPWLPSG